MTGSYTRIRLETTSPAWRVVLNRPEVRNAHDLETFKELVHAFDRAETDRNCRCIILAAEGPVFCAGQDLSFTRTANGTDRDEYGRWNVAARQRIQRNYKPVVAAVNGPAIGGGVYLATACDLVVAVDTAFFQMGEIYAGNHGGGAHLFSIGRARSLELALLGRRISAKTALEWGLINKCVPADALKMEVDDYVNALVDLPPLALRYTKAAANLQLDMAGFSSLLDAGGAMQRYLGVTPDGYEAKRAFREKRKPRFTGELPQSPHE